MIDNWPEYKKVNKAINTLVETADTIPKIKKALKHVIDIRGKRTRPVIVLLSAKLCGGKLNNVMNFALAIELIHTASLVHDDVIDKGILRRNTETLHVKYDIPLAILLGDWLISKAVELVSVYRENVIGDFARLGMTMVNGEVLDIYSITETADEKKYFKCISTKTAEIFAYGAENASKIVSNDEKAAENLYTYGKNLGIAYQLVDDMLEYLKIYEDKKSEFESRTLPMIYREKYEFKETVENILDLIRKHTAISKKALEYFERCDSREKLFKMADYLTVDLLRAYVSKNKNILHLIESYQQPTSP